MKNYTKTNNTEANEFLKKTFTHFNEIFENLNNRLEGLEELFPTKRKVFVMEVTDDEVSLEQVNNFAEDEEIELVDDEELQRMVGLLINNMSEAGKKKQLAKNKIETLAAIFSGESVVVPQSSIIAQIKERNRIKNLL